MPPRARRPPKATRRHRLELARRGSDACDSMRRGAIGVASVGRSAGSGPAARCYGSIVAAGRRRRRGSRCPAHGSRCSSQGGSSRSGGGVSALERAAEGLVDAGDDGTRLLDDLARLLVEDELGDERVDDALAVLVERDVAVRRLERHRRQLPRGAPRGVGQVAVHGVERLDECQCRRRSSRSRSRSPAPVDGGAGSLPVVPPARVSQAASALAEILLDLRRGDVARRATRSHRRRRRRCPVPAPSRGPG